MKQLSFLYAAVILLLLVSCQKERLDVSDTDPSLLRFTYTDASWPIEKGSDNNLDQTGQTISVFGYHTSDTWANSFTTATANLFNDQKVTRQSNGSWSYTPVKLWRSTGYHHFFAFSPHGTVYTVATDTTPIIVYQVPVAPINQKDLLWSLEPAVPTATQQLLNRTANSGNIDFVFGHALTKISFKALVGASIDQSRYKVSSITLQDVFYEGYSKFQPKNGNLSAPDAYTGATWIRKDLDKKQDFIALEGNALSTVLLTNTAQLITSANGYLYMLPQQIEGTNGGNDPKIVITIKDTQDNSDRVLAADLVTPSAHGWHSGQHIEYTITYNGGGNPPMSIKATVTPWNVQDVPTSLGGTYLNITKTIQDIASAGTLKLYYTTDGSPVSFSSNRATYALNKHTTDSCLIVSNITQEGTVTIKAGKLERTILIKQSVVGNVKEWDVEVLDITLPGTYLNISKDSETIDEGDTQRIFYSTDGSPVSCLFKGVTYFSTHQYTSGSGYIDIPNILTPGTATITAGKLSRTIQIQVTVVESANCYMLPVVTTPTTFKIFPKRVNEYWGNLWAQSNVAAAGRAIFQGNNPANTLGANPNWVAEILWTDFSYGTDVTVGRGSDDRIDITLGANINGGKGGNVIICVKSAAGGEILWSWHIWITDFVKLNGTKIERQGDLFASSAGVLMDRNLGARTNSQNNNSDSYGLYYQWGRKDPFPGAAARTGTAESTIYTSSGSNLYGSGGAYGEKVGHNDRSTMAQSIGSPLTLFFYTGFTNDWIGAPGDPAFQKMNRWLYNPANPEGTDATAHQDVKGLKTIYDPCPRGYRLHWKLDWSGMPSDRASCTFVNNSGYNWSYNSQSIWMPAAGLRVSNSGTLSNVGVSGYYWSSNPNSLNRSYQLFFTSSAITPTNHTLRAQSGSVRCVKE